MQEIGEDVIHVGEVAPVLEVQLLEGHAHGQPHGAQVLGAQLGALA